jgi:nucleotide-binding universal stress UspA family protein
LGAGEAKRTLDAVRLHQRRLDVEACLSALATRCAKEQVAFKPLESIGLTAEEINFESQRFDVIVMPRQFPDATDSVAQASMNALYNILHATPRPVVAVRNGAPAGEAAVVAYDGSLQAARALQAFEASGLATKLPVHVVSIDDDPREAARRGSRAIDFLTYHEVPAKLHAVPRITSPAEQLLEIASGLNAGLLVMGAYGRPRIYEFFLGSVTKTVLAKCSIPLFLYH